jgi:hypothetical protein
MLDEEERGISAYRGGRYTQKWRTGHGAIPHPGYWGAAPVALQARSASWPRPGARAGLPVGGLNRDR